MSRQCCDRDRLPQAVSRSWPVWWSARSGGRIADAGFAVVELTVLAPVFVLLLLLVVAVGRVQDAGVRVTGAARDGARAASLQRTPAAAQAAAQQAVQANLAGQSMGCVGGPLAQVDTGALTPGGLVRVTVRCVASLADVAMPGVPGSTALVRSASSPVEIYRARP